MNIQRRTNGATDQSKKLNASKRTAKKKKNRATKQARKNNRDGR